MNKTLLLDTVIANAIVAEITSDSVLGKAIVAAIVGGILVGGVLFVKFVARIIENKIESIKNKDWGFTAKPCRSCEEDVDVTANHCQVCGLAKPAPFFYREFGSVVIGIAFFGPIILLIILAMLIELFRN